ncbi:unnamed protein product [Fraxinus pennsylvanica]|uniref:Uncharacterized protein n=1 Tax=Fraxinus pennsylvanica TaxID=56036 RepID=A0AAD2DP08_9LAMI|nr:unnamed protein product [Fraxinus pennsylvanica]
MVVVTTEINGVYLRVFKWNEKLPEVTNEKGLFFVRIYEETLTVSSNKTGDGINKSKVSVMYPELITFELSSLCCSCRINQLLDDYVLSPKVAFQENIKSLTKSIATAALAYFRFKNQTLLGNGPKPVFVVEIYRHKTIDHTKEGILEEDDSFFYETLVNSACQRSISEIESDQGQDSADVNNAGILRILRYLLGIPKSEVLERIESDEPKGLYEVKACVDFQKFRARDPELDACPICIQGFSEEMVVITEEINGVHLRMFKRNEKLPETTNKKGLFLLRVYDEIITVTSNENGDGTNISIEKFGNLEKCEDETSSEEIESADGADFDQEQNTLDVLNLVNSNEIADIV